MGDLEFEDKVILLGFMLSFATTCVLYYYMINMYVPAPEGD
jgi:hypothetical protein